ncbi:MAG: ferredoxin [Puniceicoccaceae bacterium]|nr:MAG: ferredoxin [Puniceicoccaceae bacterium]
MADKTDKWPENAPGKFYVDQQCIDCDLCRETAPDFFTRNEDGGFSFVYRQPATEEDAELCREALEGCPVDAIGEDGDEVGATAPASGQAGQEG